MKKTLPGLAILALFAMGAAHAGTADTPATLSITGAIVAPEVSCAVNLINPAINIFTDISGLVPQGTDSTQAQADDVYVSIIGEGCDKVAADGHMALKLTGNPDTGDGTGLANTMVSDTSAQGVGIGLYDLNNKVLQINETQIPVTTTFSSPRFRIQALKLTGQTPVAGHLQASLTVELNRI